MANQNPEQIRKQLAQLIANFEDELRKGDLRTKVLALIPVYRRLRDMGKALLPVDGADAARERVLQYFMRYPLTVIKGDELMVVSGIQEWPRRLRELRVQFGWSIASGLTIKHMIEQDDYPVDDIDPTKIRPSDYVLISKQQDRDAAHRWNVANSIRRKKLAVRDKILEFLQANVTRPITGEELRYVAKHKTEWARRARELRTEYGWPIVTKNTGRPDLPIGVYLLEANRQSPAHDRHIPDPVRRAVLRRDDYHCTNSKCKWSHELWNRSDPRHLELHHVKEHVRGGGNTEDNLITLCTVCHDDLHRRARGA